MMKVIEIRQRCRELGWTLLDTKTRTGDFIGDHFVELTILKGGEIKIVPFIDGWDQQQCP